MNGWSVSAWVAMVIGFVSLWGDAIAEQASLSDQLVGTWSLISVDCVRPDGSRFRTFGDDPQGIAFFDRNGHYIIAVMRSDRPKFAVNDRMKGTADEYKAAAQEAIAVAKSALAELQPSVAGTQASRCLGWRGRKEETQGRLSTSP
jgi:hypothetical protein